MPLSQELSQKCCEWGILLSPEAICLQVKPHEHSMVAVNSRAEAPGSSLLQDSCTWHRYIKPRLWTPFNSTLLPHLNYKGQMMHSLFVRKEILTTTAATCMYMESQRWTQSCDPFVGISIFLPFSPCFLTPFISLISFFNSSSFQK